MTLLRLK